MTRQDALDMLAPGLRGPEAFKVAAALCNISYQAVAKWPDELPEATENRVLATIYRNRYPHEVLAKSERITNPFKAVA